MVERIRTSVTSTYSSSSLVKSFHADHESVASKASLFNIKTKQVKRTMQSQTGEELKLQSSLQITEELMSEVLMCYSSGKLDTGLHCEMEDF